MVHTAGSSERVKINHDRKVREVADSYRRRGYKVTLEPNEAELPPFLRSFRPDIVATAKDGSVVVEVKQAGKTDPARWRAMAEQIEQQAGWRLDLVVPDPDDLNNFRSLTSAEIEQRLKQARQLAETGMLDVAYMAAWSAMEATLRLMKDREEIETPDVQPGTLITRLYTDGSLDRKDYDALMKALQLRNAIAHGYQRKVQAKDITYLQNTIHKVIVQ